MSEKQIFLVAGKPVLHSLSPYIFNTVFQTLNIDACYTRLTAACAGEALKTGREMKLHGMNVTSPLKEGMADLADSLDDHAKKIKAVNTIVFQNNKAVGYNTDCKGAIQALKSNSINPRGRNIIILGAGGAARAAAYGMKISKAKKITIANRDIKKAQSLAELLGCEYTSFQRVNDLLEESDILISCIPQSISMFADTLLRKNLILLDANYKYDHFCSSQKTGQRDIRFISGLDWLFFQAMPAFQIFTGLQVPIDFQEKLHRNLKSREMPSKPHIALIGFMGSGKTTVGQLLADELGYDFIDTDLAIEQLSGQTIPEIFKRSGERVFREMETSLIEQILGDSKASVISLGGGAVMDEENLTIIRQRCLVIWLWISARGALSRIDYRTRPLLKSSDPTKNAESLLFIRKPFYARASDLVIDSEIGTAHDIVRRIKYEMDQAFRN